MTIYICLSCNKDFSFKAGNKAKYCSIKCQKNFQDNRRYDSWINGNTKAWAIGSKGLKKAVVKKNGYYCDVCKIEKWNEKYICLELEHKDGNSENNLPENLCLICPNCHSQTSTYKAKNKGNGRYSRRLRYFQRKSY